MKYSITQLFPGTKSMLYIGLTAVLMVGSLGCKKNVHKKGVVELRQNAPGGTKSYYAFVVKSEPNIPAYQLINKEKPGSSSSMDFVYWPDKSVEELGYKKDFHKYMHSTVEEEIGGKYTRTFVMAVGEGGGNIPGPNGWWGNGWWGNGGGGTGGGGIEESGYRCINGSCVFVTSGAQYPSEAACESSCGNGNSCPATGKINLKIYRPTGACAANEVRHTLRFYTCCAHGGLTDMIYEGWWSHGNDAGGDYITCLFGNEDAGVCVHGTTVKNRLYKLEWEVTPKKGSYPNTCIKSGVANIDFDNQIKNVVVEW